MYGSYTSQRRLISLPCTSCCLHRVADLPDRLDRPARIAMDYRSFVQERWIATHRTAKFDYIAGSGRAGHEFAQPRGWHEANTCCCVGRGSRVLTPGQLETGFELCIHNKADDPESGQLGNLVEQDQTCSMTYGLPNIDSVVTLRNHIAAPRAPTVAFKGASPPVVSESGLTVRFPPRVCNPIAIVPWIDGQNSFVGLPLVDHGQATTISPDEALSFVSNESNAALESRCFGAPSSYKDTVRRVEEQRRKVLRESRL